MRLWSNYKCVHLLYVFLSVMYVHADLFEEKLETHPYHAMAPKRE